MIAGIDYLPLVVPCALALLFAGAILRYGEFSSVKLPFAILGLAVSGLIFGLWLENNFAAYALFGARLNMIFAATVSVFGSLAVRRTIGVPDTKSFYWAAGLLIFFNFLVALNPQWYFYEQLVVYDWGVFAKAKVYFIFNPICVYGFATYHLFLLLRHLRKAPRSNGNGRQSYSLRFSFSRFRLSTTCRISAYPYSTRR
jgi:hypothetical protein